MKLVDVLVELLFEPGEPPPTMPFHQDGDPIRPKCKHKKSWTQPEKNSKRVWPEPTTESSIR